MDKREVSDIDSKPIPTYIDNPLSEIEMDIRALMKRCGTLTYDLNESGKKWELDTKKMLLDFIEVVDAFENLFRNIMAKEVFVDQQTKIWIGNFRSVYKMLLRALKKANVTPLETVIGEKVNPYWHNIVEVVKRPDLEDGVIVEEIKKGYLWNGELLRAADVKTVKNG